MQDRSRENELSFFNILAFGAEANPDRLVTGAIQRAVQACLERGGGTVYIPPGVFRSGPIQLGSNVTLHLEAGAVLQGSGRLEDYPVEVEKLSQESQRAGLITAHNAKNITISGRGTIDGSAMAFLYPDRLHLGSDHERRHTRQGAAFNPVEQVVHGPLAHGERPGNLVRMHGCQNVRFEGIAIQNSPTWTVHFKDCTDVAIRGVCIQSPGTDWRTPNDDGIDLEACQQVRISDCEINTGDDCIAVFGSQSVAVTNCTLRSRSAGIRVNYDLGHTRDLVFNNLIIHANRGININTRGEATTENVLFSNIIIHSRLFTGHWWGRGEPLAISAIPGSSNPLPPGSAIFNQNRATLTGWIRNVRFSNLIAEGEHGIVLYGCEQSRLQDLHFENVRLRIRNSPLHASMGGNFDLRAAARPEEALFRHDIPALYGRCVDGLRLRGFQVEWEAGLPDYFSHALQIDDFNDLQIEGFEGRQAHSDAQQAAIALTNGRGVSITGSRAGEGTGIFLALKQVEDQRLFAGNDVRSARQSVYPAASFFREPET